MGCDPSITFCRTTEKESYVYAIKRPDPDHLGEDTRYYHTQKCISDFRSLCITGRATRVWRVRRVKSATDISLWDGQAEEMVLKDVWLASDSQTERQIQDQIFADLETVQAQLLNEKSESPEFANLGSTPLRKDPVLPSTNKYIKALRGLLKDKQYRKHFLTIIDDMQGRFSPNTPDIEGGVASLHPTLFSAISSAARPATVNNPKADNTRNKASHPSFHYSPADTQKKPDFPREYFPKQRYFVVFKEVCKANHELTTFKSAVTALRGAIYAYFILFAAGWIHRDISCGNVLYYEAEDRGILSDLEYAKRFPYTTGSIDPKTGTAYFMAHEILMPPIRISGFSKNPNGPTVFGWLPDTDNSEKTVHDFLHDLESFWWLFLWIITTRFIPKSADSSTFVGTIFVNTEKGSNERRDIFVAKGNLVERLRNHLIDPLTSLVGMMEGIRQMLIETYQTFATPTTQDESRLAFKPEVSFIYRLLLSLLDSADAIIKEKTVPALDPYPGTAEEEDKSAPAVTSKSEIGQKQSSGVKRKADNAVDDPRHRTKCCAGAKTSTPANFDDDTFFSDGHRV